MTHLDPSLIRRFDLFQSMDDDALRAVLDHATTRRVPKGAAMFEQAAEAREVFDNSLLDSLDPAVPESLDGAGKLIDDPFRPEASRSAASRAGFSSPLCGAAPVPSPKRSRPRSLLHWTRQFRSASSWVTVSARRSRIDATFSSGVASASISLRISRRLVSACSVRASASAAAWPTMARSISSASSR